MRFLLDTHTLIWAAQAPERIPKAARAVIEDERNDIFVSAVSAMEIATKYRLGKLAVSPTLAEHFVREVEGQGFLLLSLNAHHAQRGGLLNIPHGDPFDRMLIAQTLIEGLTLVSNEEQFDDWHVSRLWSKPLYKE